MPTASIKVNGVAGSADDVPLNTPVLLDNAGTGGEATYAWSITDQPEGAADALSAANVQAPSFTPRKEGSYRLRLVVNASLSSEVATSAIVAVRQLKTRHRVPAAGEATEVDASRGYSTAVDRWLQGLERSTTMGVYVVAVAGVAGLVRGAVLRGSGVTVLKSGLPGQESVPTVSKALGASALHMSMPLMVLESGIDGSSSPASGALIRCRMIGFFGPVTGTGGVVTSPVYVSDLGALSLSPGTVSRKVGSVIRAGATDYDVFLSTGGFA